MNRINLLGLVSNGLSRRLAVKNPFLNKDNKEKRLMHDKLLNNWTKNQRQQVLQSENWKFENVGSNCCQYVQMSSRERSNSECSQSSGKHSGDSVMVGAACQLVMLGMELCIQKSPTDFDPPRSTIWKGSHLFFSMTAIWSILPVQYKQTKIAKHTMRH